MAIAVTIFFSFLFFFWGGRGGFFVKILYIVIGRGSDSNCHSRC